MSELSSRGWTRSAFEELTKRLVNGGTPPTDVERYWKGDIPWITGADFNSSGIGRFRRYVSTEAVADTSTNVIDEGNLLIVTRTGVGKLAIAPCDVAISQDITGVYPDPDRVDAGFLYHRMRQGVEDLKKLNQGTSINGIIRRDLLDYSVDLPPLENQRRIAKILSTVDEAIEQTEALIAKTQQIKAGLMHDLFTRGVTPDGQLRPPREEAPELYKESPLGWIPREWDVVLVDALCSQIVDCPHSTPTYVSRGIPCIRTADMHPGELLLEQAYRVTEPTYVDRVARLVPRSGDIIYSREGERLGIASPVGDERICLGQRVMLLRPNPETDGAFMLWAMNTASFYRRVVSGLGATTSPHVNVGDVRKQKILRPSISEQEVIGRTLTLLQMSLQAERTQREKYKATKFGLMNGLLTGRLRVKVDCDSRSMAVRNTNPKGDSNHESLG